MVWVRDRQRGGGGGELDVMRVLMDGRVHHLVVVLEVLVVDDDFAGVRLVQAVDLPALLPRKDDREIVIRLSKREERFLDLVIAHINA